MKKRIIIFIVVDLLIVLGLLYLIMSWNVQNSPSVVSECEDLSFIEFVQCTFSSSN